jgi:hypothetical protein
MMLQRVNMTTSVLPLSLVAVYIEIAEEHTASMFKLHYTYALKMRQPVPTDYMASYVKENTIKL